MRAMFAEKHLIVHQVYYLMERYRYIIIIILEIHDHPQVADRPSHAQLEMKPGGAGLEQHR